MKKQLTALLLFLLFGLFKGVMAQQADWRVYVEQLAEEEGMDEHTVENIYTELLFLESNPMELNSVTREQLEQFPLLSPAEVTSLVAFLTKNRPLYTVYELRNVPHLDFHTVSQILPFLRWSIRRRRRQRYCHGALGEMGYMSYSCDSTRVSPLARGMAPTPTRCWSGTPTGNTGVRISIPLYATPSVTATSCRRASPPRRMPGSPSFGAATQGDTITTDCTCCFVTSDSSGL